MSRLQALTARATAAQWTPDAVDWSLDVKLPERLPLRVYTDMVSQLYHGEEATLAVLVRLLRELPDAEARAYLRTQLADEMRHSIVYRGYLERLGDVAPIDPGLKALFDFALAFRGPAFAPVVALHVIMEHEALAQQQQRIETLPCPLFREVNRAIARDEARHAAFGVLYLKRALPAASDEDRATVTAWVKDLWRMWTRANEGRYLQAGAEVLRLERAHLAGRWAILSARLERLRLADAAELAL